MKAEQLLEKFFIFLNNLRNVNNIFWKDATYDNIKSHKENSVSPSL